MDLNVGSVDVQQSCHKDPSEWYNDLNSRMKFSVLKEAIEKYPYLALHMKLHNIRGSDKNFVNHYSFKLMIDVLRNK